MPEELQSEDNLHLEQGKNKETPTREAYRKIARAQLNSLGYGEFVKQLESFFKDQGVIADLAKALPYILGKDSDYLDDIVSSMWRVPNADEAKKLLVTALFGEPASINEDGTVIVTSFAVAQPSETTVQTKFTMARDQEDNLRYVANIKGTDELVKKLISSGGFLPQDKTAEAIFTLKKQGAITLTNPLDTSLTMELAKPKDFQEKSKSKTAYSYSVQIKLSPSVHLSA